MINWNLVLNYSILLSFYIIIFYNNDNLKFNFQNNLFNLKLKYPNLTTKFWANIESTYKHSIVMSRDPSIVLMVNERINSKLAHNISLDILNSIKSSTNGESNVVIDLSIYENMKNINSIKLDLDNKISNLFSLGQKVILIRNIELLPFEVMVLFMTYGDDYLTAKYSGVIILMTLEIDKFRVYEKDEFLNSTKKMTEYIQDYLSYKLWNNIDDEKLNPLYTRILNNLVIIW